MINKKDITELFLEIDRKIYNRINVRNKHFFGISTRLKSADGKLRNFADMEKAINDGELSLFDDRYNLTWFHRIDTVSFRGIGNSYGRGALKRNGIVNGVSVFWAKRESVDLQGNRLEIKQVDLFQMLLSSISDIDYYSVQRVDFDINAIEKQEFNTETLHKESILIKFDFELTFIPENCYGTCEEWDCCPI